MPRGWIRRRWLLVTLLVALLSAVALDVMQLTRSSGLSAIACVPIRFRGPPDAGMLVTLHREAIVRQARSLALPPTLVAALIVDHQRQITPYRAFTDCFGSALGADLSLGPAQVRMSTAAQLDGKSLATMSPREFRKLRSRLRDPESNISYLTREMRALLERAHRYPGISAESLLSNPAAMALLITEYRSGRMATSIENSRVGANAMRTLRLMQDGTLAQFEDPEGDPAGHREAIREYVERIRCEDSRFNRECEREGGIPAHSSRHS